jgi:hypothetical protein
VSLAARLSGKSMLCKAVVEQNLRSNRQVGQSSRVALDFERRFRKISNTRTTAATASILDTLLSRILGTRRSCPCSLLFSLSSKLGFVADSRRCMIESKMSNLSIARKLDSPCRCMSHFRLTFQTLGSPSNLLSSSIVV